MNWNLLRQICYCATLLICSTAAAQTPYPNRPIRLIVPTEPGGGGDLIPRTLAKYLTGMLHEPIIIDNKPGANGIIGVQIAQRAAPDGYTLVSGITGAMAINPSMYPHLSYDPVKDFEPVAMVAVGQNVLVVTPSLPVHDVQGLIDYARANPGKLNFGSSGIGGSPHMAGELLKSMSSINIVHVPYKSASAAMVDLMSGNVQLAFLGLGAALPQMKAGKVRALAVAGARRSPALPNLPTIGETLKGFDAATWFAIFAPAHTPKPDVDTLSQAIETVLKRDDVKKELLLAGYEPYIMGSDELGRYVKSENAKWAKIIQAAHITAQ